MQQQQSSTVAGVATPVPPPPPPSTEATPAPVLPGNLKNDGSFLEQFKKMQQQKSQQGNQSSKEEGKDKLSFKSNQKLALKSRFLPTPKKEKPATQMTEVFDLDYDRKYFKLEDA